MHRRYDAGTSLPPLAEPPCRPGTGRDEERQESAWECGLGSLGTLVSGWVSPTSSPCAKDPRANSLRNGRRKHWGRGGEVRASKGANTDASEAGSLPCAPAQHCQGRTAHAPRPARERGRRVPYPPTAVHLWLKAVQPKSVYNWHVNRYSNTQYSNKGGERYSTSETPAETSRRVL